LQTFRFPLMPAKAGIQIFFLLESRLRGNERK